jgi:pimeloyl-ACP methyl ester carboxylesterase
MGGYIAQELAIHNPSLVRRLILASTDFGGSKAIQPSKKVLNELEHASTTKQLLKLLFTPKAQGAGNAWYDRIGEQDVALNLPKDSFTIPAPIIRQQVNAAGPGWEARGKGSYNQLPRLRQPTLIAAGNQDVIVPPRNARLLHGRIKGSSLTIYAGAGHAFLFQSPLAVGRRVNGFLG